MGWFSRMWKQDPTARIERAEELLAAGRAYEALVAARGSEERAARGEAEAEAEVRRRARAVESRAREALVASALAEADRSEADEQYDDAADWVSAALEHAVRIEALAQQPSTDDARSSELRRRKASLRRRGRDAARQPSLMRGFEEDERPGPDPLEVESRFGARVGELHEEVADLYLHRPLPFQKAFLDLEDGRLAEALAGLDGLIAEAPDDPVLRFERGRARLLSGDAEGAREDLERAREELGDEPLDVEGELSIPRLLAELSRGPG